MIPGLESTPPIFTDRMAAAGYTRKDPEKTPNPEGASGNGYFKVYTNTLGWNWATQTSDFDPHKVYAVFNSAGVYTIEVSGRSQGHFIDRMVLYKESQYSATAAQSLTRSQTTCDGSSNPPPPPPPPPPSGSNNAPTVSITNPNNGQNFNAGANITVGLNASDSDGSIVKTSDLCKQCIKRYRWFNLFCLSVDQCRTGQLCHKGNGNG